MVALSVEDKYIHTAFGIYECFMQAGMGLTPLVMGYMLFDKKNNVNYFYHNMYLLDLTEKGLDGY